MESSVCFRDFEERDVDFVYSCKNNDKLWQYTEGKSHGFSHEDAKKWVQGCIHNDSTYKFWAICKNDATREIVGWCSISDIDYKKKSVNGHGIVIGAPEYNDGFTFIEAIRFVLFYVFEVLEFDKIKTSWLSDHPISKNLACFTVFESTEINSEMKSGRWHDRDIVSFSRNDYFKNKEDGLFSTYKILKVIAEFSSSRPKK